jgi:hypothetical protein
MMKRYQDRWSADGDIVWGVKVVERICGERGKKRIFIKVLKPKHPEFTNDVLILKWVYYSQQICTT